LDVLKAVGELTPDEMEVFKRHVIGKEISLYVILEC